MINLSREYADVIVEMSNVCWDEGIGPDERQLMTEIFREWPELYEKWTGRFYAPLDNC